MKKLIILTIILFTAQFLAPIFAQTEQKPRLVVQLWHDGDAEVAAFSPNWKILASVGEDITVKIWNVENGLLLNTMIGRMKEKPAIAFSPDSKFLALSSWNQYKNTIQIWDVEIGQEIKIIESNFLYYSSSNLYWLFFSQDGKSLALGNKTQIIGFWDAKTGELVTTKIDFPTNLTQDISPNGKIRAEIDNEKIVLRNIDLPQEIKTLEGYGSPVAFANLSSLRKTLVTSSNDKKIHFWNIESGKQVASVVGHTQSSKSIIFSDDGKIMASGGDNKTVKLWEVDTGKELKTFKGFRPLKISKDGKTLISTDCCFKIQLWDLNSELETNTFEFRASMITSLSLSPDGKILATGTMGPWVNLLNAETGEHIKFFEIRGEPTRSVTFSEDGKILAASLSDSTIKLWDVETGKVLQSLKHGLFFGEPVNVVKFSSNGKFLLSGSSDKTIKIWDVKTGQEINTLEGHESDVTSITFLPNENFIFSSSRDGTVKLWDVTKKNSLATLISLNKDEWVVTTSDGRFDTNKLENPRGLHWIMPDAPFDPLSFEVFMRDYYEPNLLPRLLKCNEENNCETEFKPVRNLTELNRTQPKVNIVDIKATDAADLVQVTIAAENVVSEFQRDKQGKFLRSGVWDLRLFRDGQLVGYAPEGAVAVDKNGKFTKAFKVRLPKNRDAKEFNFTAYAFNSDRVKSETAQKTYTLLQSLPNAKGSAYIVTIGINANENSDYNLRYAANDARRLQEELSKKLPKDKYNKIVQIPLISDFDNSGKLNENNATKSKIKAVLDKLAGKTVAADALKDVANADLLKKVLPEDLVLIAFSGHGYADREGIFYLIPYDIGASASGGLGSVLQKSISSDELSLWLRDIDAGEMMMIVDACHSAAAVQGKDFKPGPMGSRGLGQLSYDKGMRILTATQADNVALELGKLQHGLLTYSLVKNGLELGLADFQPQDNKLFTNEWLSFTLRDVPQLYEKAEKGELKDLFIDGKPKSGVYKLDGQKSNLNLQQPSLFDFSRRDRLYQLY